MNLEELKALLESGAITQEQFNAMVQQLGLNVTNEDEQNENDNEDDVKLIEKKIQSAVDKAVHKYVRENKDLKNDLEKLRKEKLTAEELQKLEAEEKEKDLAEREAAIKAAENKLYAVKAIKQAGLDDGSETALDILALVNAADEAAIDTNIKALKALVDKLVKAEVEKTFKNHGRNPEKSAGGGADDNPYLSTNFNFTKQMELEATNPELAKKYKAAAGIKE